MDSINGKERNFVKHETKISKIIINNIEKKIKDAVKVDLQYKYSINLPFLNIPINSQIKTKKNNANYQKVPIYHHRFVRQNKIKEKILFNDMKYLQKNSNNLIVTNTMRQIKLNTIYFQKESKNAEQSKTKLFKLKIKNKDSSLHAQKKSEDDSDKFEQSFDKLIKKEYKKKNRRKTINNFFNKTNNFYSMRSTQNSSETKRKIFKIRKKLFNNQILKNNLK